MSEEYNRSSANTQTVVEPNSRFAISHLDRSRQHAAVLGEVMIDKTNGKVFVKRPYDGAVVSYNDTVRDNHAFISNLHYMYGTRPITAHDTNKNGLFCVERTLHLADMNGGEEWNLAKDPIWSSPLPTRRFPVHANSTGLFYKVRLRECDAEFLNTMASFLSPYNANNDSTRPIKVSCELRQMSGSTTKTLKTVSNAGIVANEMSYMAVSNGASIFGSSVYDDFAITSISCPLLNTIESTYKTTTDANFKAAYNALRPFDGRIVVESIEIICVCHKNHLVNVTAGKLGMPEDYILHIADLNIVEATYFLFPQPNKTLFEVSQSMTPGLRNALWFNITKVDANYDPNARPPIPEPPAVDERPAYELEPGWTDENPGGEYRDENMTGE